MDARLYLKSTPSVIGSLSDFAYKWSLNAGLSEDDATRLALALTELVTDIVLFAYRDEPGDFEVSFQHNTSTVEVVIHEGGEPFNLDRHRYDREAALREGHFDGAGFELVQHLVDDFIFLNKGKGGKEFRIAKVITSEHIAHLMVEEDLKPPPDPAPPTPYRLSLMTPADAEDAARLIYRTYGHSYIKEELYFPKKIEQALEQGNKFGVIVRTPEQEAVGYFAVLSTTDSKIGEVGEAVVSPRHRRRGIMTLMLDALIEESKRRGLLGLFGEAVTAHDISQRVNAKFNMQSTALLLSAFPAVRYKDLLEDYDQNLSVVIDFLPLMEVSKKDAYLPEPYAEILTSLYRSLGITVHDQEAGMTRCAASTVQDVTLSYIHGHAAIVLRHYGDDFAACMQETIGDLLQKNLRVVYIDLPLDNPYTKSAVSILRDHGFIFCGLMPLFHQERDYLRLQRLFEPIDLGQLVLYSEMATTLCNQIARERSWTMTEKAPA